MTTFQRVIKYIAIAFATFLSINIIFAMCFGLTIAVGVLSKISGEKQEITISEDINYSKTYYDITDVKIESDISKLKILTGTEFKVESSKEIKTEQKGTTLVILEKFKYKNEIPEIIVYIPSELNSFALEAGSGDVLIENLTANVIDIEVGAGNLNVKNIVSKNETDIDGGAGKVLIENAILNNLNLNVGIGDFTLEGKILGNSKMDVGIGKLEVNLSERDYTIFVKKGIGKFTIDGNDIANNTKIGEGKNRLDIDSGIGAVIVNFK